MRKLVINRRPKRRIVIFVVDQITCNHHKVRIQSIYRIYSFLIQLCFFTESFIIFKEAELWICYLDEKVRLDVVIFLCIGHSCDQRQQEYSNYYFDGLHNLIRVKFLFNKNQRTGFPSSINTL